jgi:hypothetical protein
MLQKAPESAMDRLIEMEHASEAQTTVRRQITMSPYYGATDFSCLTDDGGAGRDIDTVSLADLLRNGFVYPPHSVFTGVKVATFGFDPEHDLHGAPVFRFGFPDSGKGMQQDGDADLVGTYHRLLCAAFDRACGSMHAPWLLQSGGKDSTPLAIAASEVRPDTTCITYLGGSEEDEVSSAWRVAQKLGLRHETLVCDPGRAYDRYLEVLPRMPLLTADFALLSYVDLASTIAASGGDGIVDGMGSDNYIGIPVGFRHRLVLALARGLRLPGGLLELPVIGRSFRLCYLLSSLQMQPIERIFPGSRFTDAEVDVLFGRPISRRSIERLDVFKDAFESTLGTDERVALALTVAGGTGGFAKGLCAATALSLQSAFPFCDLELREWMYRQVPLDQLVDPHTRTSKVLVRRHIQKYFDDLPYVDRKGSFRFDLRGLARQRFDQVHDFAVRTRDFLPGASPWLLRNRKRLGNKYHASRFYLLAVVLPWIAHARETNARRRLE